MPETVTQKPPGTRKVRREAGFTLLEVLIALAILSATLVLAFRVLSGAIAAEERSEQWTVEAFLGDNVVRDALSGFPEVGETEGRFPAPYEAYTWKRTVKQALHPDAREVHVVVTRKEGEREESVALAGIAAK
jgi:type II secretion system protein I